MTKIGPLHRRYLRLLGIEGIPSGIEGLHEIVRRHLCCVPFENLSKLLLFGREGAGRITTLSEFLDGIEHDDLGGTCYSSNPFLAELLRALGYDADLLGADMNVPNLHTSVRVRLEGVEYHVDAGYAAPFYRPMRLDRLPLEIAHGNHRYLFDRSARDGAYEMTVFSNNERAHGYLVHGPPCLLEFFQPIILDSFQRGRKFMSSLRITRFFEDYTVELRNNTLIHFRGKEREDRRLTSYAELEAAVRDDFRMPRCPLREAVQVLERVTGSPLF